MSGANAGGGCWWCSIKNDQLGILLPASFHSKLKTQNSKLKTLSPFTRSGYDEVISGSWIWVEILRLLLRQPTDRRWIADGGNIQYSTRNIQCTIKNDQLGIMLPASFHSKLITLNFNTNSYLISSIFFNSTGVPSSEI